ncbi:AraC family transcriptional regulator [Demequina sp. SYSU T00192]|uniref:AraC family transcriptional regulator n=1 Tax=Demequina litoralis TaxID=3051660 RepID=A0ABT8GBM7_9MICO|nr:AraC family transcriptional regulator [Demequina sp. SYSU T00192]MDN4476457.1 AraC family transcriptional regulator [Demequina sp. SYSU T00192]
MDETLTVPPGALRDGFEGQRMFVVPRPTVRAVASKQVTGRLMVTDAGMFPKAAHHGRVRPEGSGEHIVMVCTGGGGWCETTHGRSKVDRGDAVLIPAGTPHEYHADDEAPWTLWWFHAIGPDADELLSAARAAAAGAVSHLRDAAPVASLISQIIDALDSGTPGGHVRASGAAWNALTHVIATGRRARGPALSPVERAIDHLRATTPDRTSVEALASMVGLSAPQLTALFRQHVGMPPLRYQNSLRMALARELLDSTDLTVAAVARAAGFSDPLYFSRSFSRAHGESPSQYRERGH